MRKLLNRIVNAYEVFCWEEDFSQEMPDVLGEEEELADIEVSEDEEQPLSLIHIFRRGAGGGT